MIFTLILFMIHHQYLTRFPSVGIFTPTTGGSSEKSH
jgi:hypothetical protein